MITFKQFRLAEQHEEWTDWIKGGIRDHVTQAQLNTIGRHTDHHVYTAGVHQAPVMRAQKNYLAIQHIDVHNPETKHTIRWHLSRRGKHYAHTVYSHHEADESHEHPYMKVVKHWQLP